MSGKQEQPKRGAKRVDKSNWAGENGQKARFWQALEARWEAALAPVLAGTAEPETLSQLVHAGEELYYVDFLYKNAKFYEVTKYIILTDHVVASVWPTINEKKWQSLSSSDRDLVMKAIDKAREACAKQNLETEGGILKFFKEQGMIIIDNPDKKAFAEYAKNSYQTESKHISEKWDWALYERIQALRP